MVDGDTTPFHDGERRLQAAFGVADRLAVAGRHAIRPFMPDQHRAFFAALPYLIVAAADAAGRPWATMITGPAGFLGTPSATRLAVDRRPPPGDPVGDLLCDGVPVAVLGIDLATRRRNRLNGHVAIDAGVPGFAVAVDQSFGNCPQYIEARAPAAASAASATVEEIDMSDPRIAEIVGRADAFFIASQNLGAEGRAAGLDVSHRGGRAGFAAITGDTLAWPEYRGNFYFNTLGNLVVDRRCGLLFPDFSTGALLHITGDADIVERRDAPAALGLGVRVHIAAARLNVGAMPENWTFLGHAPQNV